MGGKLVTFREWSENFAKINFNLVGWAEITCRLNGNRLLFTKEEKTFNKIKSQPGNILLELYRDNFDVIQLNYQNLLREYDQNN